jgi:uncharacterized protein YbbC (DUF1343 family)
MSWHQDLLRGKRIGLVTNHTALLSDGRHLVDVLQSIPGAKIQVIFGPEHGFRGDAPDGQPVRDSIDQKKGILLRIIDRQAFEPVRTAVHILSALEELYPTDFQWRSPARSEAPYYIGLLAGTQRLRRALAEGRNAEEIASSWIPGLKEFNSIRQKYLLY